jgi:Flp pilus assembly protein TadD
MAIESEAGHLVIRDDMNRWRADSGQLLFPFDLAPAGAEISEMPVRHEAPGPEPTPSLTADEWFEQGLAIEDEEPDGAIAAYRRACALRPDGGETFINLGRLLAETGQVEEAEDCFRVALERDPNDSTAVYNLGVVAQDLGRDDEAIALYHRALDLEPVLAEAHYNLATIFDRSGDARAAIRHINEYHKLTRTTPAL